MIKNIATTIFGSAAFVAVFVLPVASCESNSLEDAGPCGSLSCGRAMFHDQRVLYELTKEACERGAEVMCASPECETEQKSICEDAFNLSLAGE